MAVIIGGGGWGVFLWRSQRKSVLNIPNSLFYGCACRLWKEVAVVDHFITEIGSLRPRDVLYSSVPVRGQ